MITKKIMLTDRIYIDKIKDFQAEDVCELVAPVFANCSDYFMLVDGIASCNNRAHKECHELSQKNNSIVWLIFEQNIIAGVAFTAECNLDEPTVDIFLFLIEGKSRNKKIGSHALATIEKELYIEGTQKIVLAVDMINTAALAFWQASGYCDTGLTKTQNNRRGVSQMILLNKKLTK